MPRFVDNRLDLAPENRELINKAWMALIRHLNSRYLEDDNKRVNLKNALAERMQALFDYPTNPVKTVGVFTQPSPLHNRDPMTAASWPLYAFNRGFELLFERSMNNGAEEGNHAPSLKVALANFTSILEDKLTLSFPQDEVSPQAMQAITEELQKLGWRSNWFAKLEAVDGLAQIMLTATSGYGVGTQSLTSPLLVRVTYTDLEINGPFDRWYLRSEAKAELEREINQRCEKAEKMVIEAANVFQDAAAIRRFADKF